MLAALSPAFNLEASVAQASNAATAGVLLHKNILGRISTMAGSENIQGSWPEFTDLTPQKSACIRLSLHQCGDLAQVSDM